MSLSTCAMIQFQGKHLLVAQDIISLSQLQVTITGEIMEKLHDSNLIEMNSQADALNINNKMALTS